MKSLKPRRRKARKAGSREYSRKLLSEFLEDRRLLAVDVIDFESGFADRQLVSEPVVTSNNVVTLSTIPQTTGSNPGAFIADRGNSFTAFGGIEGYDNVTNSSVMGNYFLTDEDSVGATTNSGSYLLEFAIPVSSVSLDVYDLDGYSAVLDVYSDTQRTQLVGTTSASGPDGGITNLAANTSSADIVAAVVRFPSNDPGTGIDNITIDTPVVPGISSTSVDSTGALPQAEPLVLQFNTNVSGHELADTYQLQGAGADGLLGTADDPTYPVTPTSTPPNPPRWCWSAWVCWGWGCYGEP